MKATISFENEVVAVKNAWWNVYPSGNLKVLVVEVEMPYSKAMDIMCNHNAFILEMEDGRKAKMFITHIPGISTSINELVVVSLANSGIIQSEPTVK